MFRCLFATLQVSAVVHNTTLHIESVLHSMDSLMLTLDQPSVSAVYFQGKNFFCCNLANQIYTQWAASITVVALAWAAMLCAWYVLRSLDLLSGKSKSCGTCSEVLCLRHQEALRDYIRARCIGCPRACAVLEASKYGEWVQAQQAVEQTLAAQEVMFCLFGDCRCISLTRHR